MEPYPRTGLDETTAKIYGMVRTWTETSAACCRSSRRSNLERNTILIFLTDNGPQQKRYNAGMRGLKGTVYEGGIRVPCFVRWPAVVKPGSRIDHIAAHIDLLPTILDACGRPQIRRRAVRRPESGAAAARREHCLARSHALLPVASRG